MINYTKKWLFLFLLVVALMSCTSQSNTSSGDMEEAFQSMMQIEDMNKSIRIQLNSDKEMFPSNSDIPLIFYNESPNSVFFATDKFIKLFIADNNEWLEIKNKNTYSGRLLLSPKGTALRDFNRAVVRPVIEDRVDNNKKGILVRVVMIGEILENEVHTGKFVGAFVNVYISP